MSQDYHDRSGLSLSTEFLDNLLHGSDRDRAGLLFVVGAFLFGVGACVFFSSLRRESLAYLVPWILIGSGLLLFGSAAFFLKWRVQAEPDVREVSREPLSQALGCTACGTSNPPGSEYCGECGAALTGAEV